MIFTTTGKSIKELLEIYGTDSSGFYPQDWYKNETFFTEKPEAGTYDIGLDYENEAPDRGKTFSEQVKNLKDEYISIHPAILCEMMLSHYKKTGVRLLENTYSRTSCIVSDGRRVYIGDFGAGGLVVDNWYGDCCDDDIGLSAARKLPLKTGGLETSELLVLGTLCPHCGESVRVNFSK